MDNEPIIIRIDDYLCEVTILGDNEDGTIAIDYNVITKDPKENVDHDKLQPLLSEVINKILKDHIDGLDSE